MAKSRGRRKRREPRRANRRLPISSPRPLVVSPLRKPTVFESIYVPSFSRPITALQYIKSLPKSSRRWSPAVPSRLIGPLAAAQSVQSTKQRVRRPVCVSRQARKEVMFATGNAGRVGQKPPVWTQKSKQRCK